MSTGEKLRRWRKSVGISQAEAAKRVGTSQKTWAAWEVEATPEVDYAEALERLTDGVVSIRDWVRSRRKKRRGDAERAAGVESNDASHRAAS